MNRKQRSKHVLRRRHDRRRGAVGEAVGSALGVQREHVVAIVGQAAYEAPRLRARFNLDRALVALGRSPGQRVTVGEGIVDPGEEEHAAGDGRGAQVARGGQDGVLQRALEPEHVALEHREIERDPGSRLRLAPDQPPGAERQEQRVHARQLGQQFGGAHRVGRGPGGEGAAALAMQVRAQPLGVGDRHDADLAAQPADLVGRFGRHRRLSRLQGTPASLRVLHQHGIPCRLRTRQADGGVLRQRVQRGGLQIARQVRAETEPVDRFGQDLISPPIRQGGRLGGVQPGRGQFDRLDAGGGDVQQGGRVERDRCAGVGHGGRAKGGEVGPSGRDRLHGGGGGQQQHDGQ